MVTPSEVLQNLELSPGTASTSQPGALLNGHIIIVITSYYCGGDIT